MRIGSCKMLALGLDPAEEIDVRRDGQPVFLQQNTVRWWAARTVTEDSRHGPRIRLLMPTERPHSAISAKGRPEHPESETLLHAPSVGEGA